MGFLGSDCVLCPGAYSAPSLLGLEEGGPLRRLGLPESTTTSTNLIVIIIIIILLLLLLPLLLLSLLLLQLVGRGGREGERERERGRESSWQDSCTFVEAMLSI